MKHISKKVGLILLTLFLIIAAHTHHALAEEVEVRNNTSNDYVIEYSTWSTDAFNPGKQKLRLYCKANRICKTESNTDPQDTGSMGVKLTGQFLIKDRSDTVISRREMLPEAERQYRCAILIYMQQQKTLVTYYDH